MFDPTVTIVVKSTINNTWPLVQIVVWSIVSWQNGTVYLCKSPLQNLYELE